MWPQWCVAALLLVQLGAGQDDSAPLPNGERHPPSPCPAVFSYENDRTWNTRWYGVLLIDTQTSSRSFTLRILLSRRADLLGTWSGTVTSDDNELFTLVHPASEGDSQGSVSVRFFVNFPRDGPVPRVTAIWKDGSLICGTVGGSVTPVSVQTPTRPPNRTQAFSTPPPRPPPRPTGSAAGTPPPQNYHTRPTTYTVPTRPNTRPTVRPATRPVTTPVNVRRTTPFPGTVGFPGQSNTGGVSSSQQCGQSDPNLAPARVQFVVGGENSYHGEWPWHVAIYETSDGDPKYTCGGTLISKRAIVTAGHCVTNKATGRKLPPDDLIVYLGKHSRLYGWNPTEGVQTFTPEEIVRHPSYDQDNLTGDIAIIRLPHDANLTSYVRLICLWPRETSIRGVEGQVGTVVGWGFDSSNKPTKELMKTGLRVRSYEECVRSHSDFFSRFLVDKTFCAGYTNGTSACNGDSGGGLVLQKDGRWHIRGIVSNGVPSRDNQFLCSSSHYTIFVDVAQYHAWIKQNVPELQNTV